MSSLRTLATVSLVGLALAFQPAPSEPLAAGDTKVKVVASLPNLASITQAIGGERIELATIASGTQDAHFVDPKPSYMLKLRKADLLLINGLDLEIGWIPPITQGARNPKILLGASGYVDCSQGIQVVEVPTNLTRAEGDVHPYGNPHYLTDPLNAEIVAGTIAEALKETDPASSGFYEESLQAYVKKVNDAIFGKELVDLVGGTKLAREARAGNLDTFLDGTSVGGSTLRSRLEGWLGKTQPVKGRPVITYHRDYSYFAQRFGIRVAEYVEPKPGIQPSAKHLEDLVRLLQRGDIHVIFTRPYVEHRSTDWLTGRTEVRVITLPLEVGGAPGITDYFQLFDYVTDQVVQALTGGPEAGGR